MDSTSLDDKSIKRVQYIVGALLFYGRAVDKKLSVAINTIGTQHSASTESTNEAINHLLDYCATYPNDGIVYRSIKIVPAAHSDYVFHNESKGQIRVGSHVFLAEDEKIPICNVPILTISQVIKIFMS